MPADLSLHPSGNDLPKEPSARTKRSKLTTHQIAEAVLSTEHFALDPGGRLYAYRDGAYRSDGRRHLNYHIKRYLASQFRADEWSNYRTGEVRGYIEADAPMLWSRPPAGSLNLLNGLLDLTSLTLWPHDPSHLSPIQLPIRYDVRADCSEWARFSQQVLPSDAQNLLFEMAAWLMVPSSNIQKAVLFLGDGANGKSTALSALVAFLGARNVVGISLQKLERDRFATARLVGKLANICADLPSTHLDSTSTFKALTGDEPVLTAEHKHLDSFEFDCFARLIFSANQPPRSSDDSEGFFRRWLVVPFEREFNERTATPRDQLDARLHAPDELSGVLNRALALLPQISTATNLTETASMKAAHAAFRQATDPLGVWLDRSTISGPDLLVPCSFLIDAYNDDASRNGRAAVTLTRFGRSLRRLRPTVEVRQRTFGGTVQRCYAGLGLRSIKNNS